MWKKKETVTWAKLKTNSVLWWLHWGEEDTESLQQFERGQGSCSTSVLQNYAQGAWLWLDAMWMRFCLVSMRTFLTIRMMSTALFVSRRQPCLLGQWLPGCLNAQGPCDPSMWRCSASISRQQVSSRPEQSHPITSEKNDRLQWLQ